MEKKATFGAGCFWGVEAAFRQLDGVTATEVGYDGVDNLGTDLYHGELALDAAPPATGETRLVTLYAAAAQ